MLEVLRNHTENQDGNKPFAIDQAEAMLVAAGVTSTGPMVIKPRLSHERDWTRQSEDLAYHFAKPLGKTRWQYLDECLPQYTPQQDSYRGEFDRLVLVQLPQPKLPLKRILEIVGINDYNPDVLKMNDWTGHKGKFKTPHNAYSYATYVEDEEKRSERLGTPPLIVRENLVAGQRVGTGLDGVFIYVSDRGVLTRHYLDLPGSEVGAGRAPFLLLWDDGPRLDLRRVGNGGPDCASVVAGDDVVIRELAA